MNNDIIIYACPQCLEQTTYVTNPYYVYKHLKEEGGCGFVGTESDLIKCLDSSAFKLEQKSLLDKLQILNNLQNKYKPITEIQND